MRISLCGDLWSWQNALVEARQMPDLAPERSFGVSLPPARAWDVNLFNSFFLKPKIVLKLEKNKKFGCYLKPNKKLAVI
jgi:hypothetical protein